MILTARKNVDFGAFFLEEAEKRPLDERLLNTIATLLTSFLWFGLGVLVYLASTYCLYLLSLPISSGEKKTSRFLFPPPPRRQHVRG